MPSPDVLNDKKLLERVLEFCERLSPDPEQAKQLRHELVELLFAFRAQGLAQAAQMVRRARHDLGRENLDPVARFVLARLEEELRSRAAGMSPEEQAEDWLSRIA